MRHHGGVRRRAATAAALASGAAVGAVLCVLLVWGAELSWVTREGPGQVALDSVAATVGLLLAFLLYGRFLDSRQQGDALLSAALLSLAAGNLLFAVVPVVVGDSSRLSSASAMAGLGAGVLFAAAVLARRDAVSSSRHVPAMVVLLATLVLAVSWLTSRLLPRAGGASADTAGIGSDPFLVVVQVLAAAAFLAAAVGWCREAARGERLAPLLAVASVLAASFRVTFALAQEGDAPEVTAGTLLRAAFYVTLLVAAATEIRSYWRQVAAVAVLEERRRIARDLHDGLAQELAFTATQAQALAERSEHPARAQLIAAAAQRALDESRRAIAALTRPIDEPVEVALAQSAEDVCGRFGTGLVLDVQSGLQVAPDEREALVRIVREAVANAARHGGAGTVTVRLHGPDPVRLVVEDDGSGFDADDRRHLSGRLGLTSMRERAEAVGGTFRLSSRSPGGTVVEVVLP